MAAAWLRNALSLEGFQEGFVKSGTLILVSEIGDKTFFIAAIMAMRHPQLTVLAGALSALWIMTALSAAIGTAAPALISPQLTHHAATALFFFFGARTLYGAILGWEGGGELAEVEAEIQGGTKEEAHANGAAGANGHSAVPAGAPRVLRSAGKAAASRKKPPASFAAPAAPRPRLFSPVLAQAFTLTFLAEWGDRSQIATIGLAASSNPLGVTAGGCLGHAVCTGAAVAGGRQLASMISERAVAIAGGALFLAFGLHSLLTGPE